MSNIEYHDGYTHQKSTLSPSLDEKKQVISQLTQAYIDYKINQKNQGDFYTCEAIEDSNMNLVLKVRIGSKVWIVKHADPWVRKYPNIAAPVSRTRQEAYFYEAFEENQKLKELMPQYLGYKDKENFLVLEYIDNAISGMCLYEDNNAVGIPLNMIEQGISYLSSLHLVNPDTSIDWSNLELRELNYLHIFEFPFNANNGIDLNQFCQGLDKLGRQIQQDEKLKKASLLLGSMYINAKGPALLHGDFYPGSWLVKNQKMYIIDPEFCFLGPAEFDLGVLLAHHLITGGSTLDIEQLINSYKNKISSGFYFDETLCQKFCGIEVLRRLLGAAQLPINWSLSRYERMLSLGREFCLL